MKVLFYDFLSDRNHKEKPVRAIEVITLSVERGFRIQIFFYGNRSSQNLTIPLMIKEILAFDCKSLKITEYI